MKNTIIFFDINGTLIKRDERTDIPYENSVKKLLNIEKPMVGVDTSARSDKDVLIEILNKNNIAFTNSLWDKFLKIYQNELEKFKNTDVWRENADAISFVSYLYDKKYSLALITGELSIGAKYKLEKLGIWDKFITGGFGEDGLIRFDIADAAKKKLLNKKKNLKINDSYVIGDTTLDIKTARHLSAKCISITTGSNTRSELEELSPFKCIDKFYEIQDMF